MAGEESVLRLTLPEAASRAFRHATNLKPVPQAASVPGGCCRIRGTRLSLLWETFRTWMRTPPPPPVVGAPGQGLAETVRPPLRPAPVGRLPALQGQASCFRSFPAGTVLCGAGG
ncbi:unnamed protein product [Rangifer tarandus platyrhynchus]|uniref:Uncharacterized protein n=1 Tax=Rangifer tarandus platyrhynchus TaxID=3082113 RepID=A0AC59ZQC7_RANTA